MGTATIKDRCTTVGPNLIDQIITLPPDGLSTWKPPVNKWYNNYDMFTVSERWHDPSGQFNMPIAYGVAPLNLKDLACPTWGLGRSTSIDGSIITTIGPPWLPLVVPPTEIFSLNSIWASYCTGLLTDQFALSTFALFDPPIALTPAAVLLSTSLMYPTPTPVPIFAGPTTSERVSPSRNYPKPASLPIDSMAPPVKTKDSEKDTTTKSPVKGSADASPLPDSPAASSKAGGDPRLDQPSSFNIPSFSTAPGDPPANPVASSSTTLDQPSDLSQKSPSNTRIPLYSAVPGDPLAESIALSSSAVDPPSGGLRNSPSKTKGPSLSAISGHPTTASLVSSFSTLGPPPDHSQPSPSDLNGLNPIPLLAEGTQTQTQGIGAIIFNAFGKHGPDVDGIKSAVKTLLLPAQPMFNIDAQTFTANPTEFIVINAAISPGGTAHIVDDTTISLDKSGVSALDSSTVSLTNPSVTPVLAVAGQTFTPNPSVFSIAGTIISAGGSAITVDGTTVSLDASGALAIGSTTISLTNPSPTPSTTEIFTVADQTFTPNPSAFSIDSTPISVDGPAATISGTIISLGQNGVLEIGSSTVSLLTTSDIYPSKAYTIAGQTFTPNPSAFSIAGTTISAGGSAVTVDGTVVSLGQSGVLAIGSSIIALPTQSYTPSKAYTIAGQTFTPDPSAFALAGTTVSVSGPAATVDGTVISLQPSGILLIGSSTILLSTTPPPTFPSLDIDIDGFNVKAESSSIVIVNGQTLSAGAAGVTLPGGNTVSLEAGGATLDIGTGRFALPTPTGSTAIGTSIDDVQAFTGGGQGKEKELTLSSLLLVVCGVCSTFSMLLMI